MCKSNNESRPGECCTSEKPDGTLKHECPCPNRVQQYGRSAEGGEMLSKEDLQQLSDAVGKIVEKAFDKMLAASPAGRQQYQRADGKIRRRGTVSMVERASSEAKQAGQRKSFNELLASKMRIRYARSPLTADDREMLASTVARERSLAKLERGEGVAFADELAAAKKEFNVA